MCNAQLYIDDVFPTLLNCMSTIKKYSSINSKQYILHISNLANHNR